MAPNGERPVVLVTGAARGIGAATVASLVGRYVDPYQERIVPAIASLTDQGLAYISGRREVR
jgi:hypothetical protein